MSINKKLRLLYCEIHQRLGENSHSGRQVEESRAENVAAARDKSRGVYKVARARLANA